MAAKVPLSHSALQDAYERDYHDNIADIKKQINRQVFGASKPWCAAEVKARELSGLKSIVPSTTAWTTDAVESQLLSGKDFLDRIQHEATTPKEIKKMSKKELHETVMLMQENIQSLRVIKNRQDDDLDTAKRHFNDELERIERESSDPKVEKKILAKLRDGKERDGKEVWDKSNKDVQFKRAVMNLRHKGLVTTSRWNNCVTLTDTAKDYEELL